MIKNRSFNPPMCDTSKKKWMEYIQIKVEMSGKSDISKIMKRQWNQVSFTRGSTI